MKRSLFFLILGMTFLFGLSNCTKTETGIQPLKQQLVIQDPAKVASECVAAKDSFLATVNQIGNLKPEQVTVENTLLAFERANAEYYDKAQLLYFMKFVGNSEALRAEGLKCEKLYARTFIEAYSNYALYQNMKTVEQKYGATLPELEKKLLNSHLYDVKSEDRPFSFKETGMELKEDKDAFAKYQALNSELVGLYADFQEAVAASEGFIDVTKEELLNAGIRPDKVEFFGKLNDEGKRIEGKYALTIDTPHYFYFQQNSKDAKLREKLLVTYGQRGGKANIKRLKRALQIRLELAKLLKNDKGEPFKNFAEITIKDRMAKTPEAVLEFYKKYQTKLQPLGKLDLDLMLDLKKKEDPEATELKAWDIMRYENLLKLSKKVDNEKVAEYFPLEVVTKGLFDIYQGLLGVKFVEETKFELWHPSVKGYRIEQDGKTIAYFFMDLFPRKGKYDHAAAFDNLGRGYEKADGTYTIPASCIVSNFTPPEGDKPSLLTHDEVETYFHEFGHIMHQVLTRVKYGSLSGTSVARDFVEAPSQMLENWVWKEKGLEKLSGHYKDNSQKLPKELLDKLLESKYLNSGYFNLRQISLGMSDMVFHTDASILEGAQPQPSSEELSKLSNDEIELDAADKKLLEVWNKIFTETSGVAPHPDTYSVAGFGHLMGGYAAGYYGYLWSKRFAEDMFTRFEGDIFNAKVGADYRKWILEPGATKDPLELVEGFLGREVQDGPFETSLGLGRLENKKP